MTVYKYQLQNATKQTIELPYAALPLAVQMQHGVICLWCKINTENTGSSCEPRTIYIHGTGHPILDPCSEYIGTVQYGPLVWHVFMENV